MNRTDKNITVEAPKRYSHHNIVYWEPTSKELKVKKEAGDKQAGVYLTKAKEMLHHRCIQKTNDSSWICLPIPNYNHSTYKIRFTDSGWDCNCQGFNMKKKAYDSGKSSTEPICSHIIGVIQYNFIQEKNNEE